MGVGKCSTSLPIKRRPKISNTDNPPKVAAMVITRCISQRTGLGSTRILSYAIIMMGGSSNRANITIIMAVRGKELKNSIAVRREVGKE